MTQRLIGLSSGHIQAYISPYYKNVQTEQGFELLSQEVSEIPGIVSCYPEIDLTSLVTVNDYKTGAQVRAVPKDIFSTNQDFCNLIEFVQGSADDV